MPTVHVIIKGRVQGVYFRASAKDVADEIGVSGWVKNTEEGDVEIMATGSKEQLQKLVEWCKVGPRRAVVTEVSVTDKEEISFKTFDVIRRY
ncbi:MAG: acylphosphatase [Flavisolibacter sp.]